jgi:2-aminobenzoylacetyl-CoA thioesterase
LTHTHSDHVGAVPRLKDIWPHLQVVGGDVAQKFLQKERFVRDFLPADKMIADLLLEKGDIEKPPQELQAYRFRVDTVIPDGGGIDLGDGIRWQVCHTPGHARCHICLFEEQEAGLAIGDMTGYFDPDLDVFWPNYSLSLEAYCRSIRRAPE